MGQWRVGIERDGIATQDSTGPTSLDYANGLARLDRLSRTAPGQSG